MTLFSIETANTIMREKGREAFRDYCLGFAEGNSKDPDALVCLGSYYDCADETERDLGKAEIYYKEAASCDSPVGIIKYADFMRKNSEIPSPPTTATALCTCIWIIIALLRVLVSTLAPPSQEWLTQLYFFMDMIYAYSYLGLIIGIFYATGQKKNIIAYLVSGLLLINFPAVIFDVWTVIFPKWTLPTSTEWICQTADLAGKISICLLIALFVFIPSRVDKRAYTWVAKAAKTGSAHGIYELGHFLYEGIGCTEDKETAIKLYEEAAEKGSEEAMIALGDAYRLGRGKTKDYQKAFNLYREAANMGNANGQYMIAYCYENGIWVNHNSETAKAWYIRAKENGSSLASAKLNRRANPIEKLFCTSSNMNEIHELLRLLKSVHEDVGAIKEDTGIIRADIEKILSALSDIKAIKEKYTEQLEKEAGAEKEALIHKISEEICQIMVRQVMKDAATSAEYTMQAKIEKYLKGLFGDTWSEMTEYTRNSLLSAHVFLNGTRNEPNLDYSGVCIAACSALEMELKKLFFTGYIEHLKKGKNISKWPSSLTYKDKKDQTLKPVDKFTLGNFVFICGLKGNEAEEHASSMKEYLPSISKGDVSVSIHQLHNFAERCQKLCDGFRNPAAHTEPVSRTDAEECCHTIVYRDDANTEVGKITGLLYELLTMFKAPMTLF